MFDLTKSSAFLMRAQIKAHCLLVKNYWKTGTVGRTEKAVVECNGGRKI